MSTEREFSESFAFRARFATLSGISILPLLPASYLLPVATCVGFVGIVNLIFEKPSNRSGMALFFLVVGAACLIIALTMSSFLAQMLAIGLVDLIGMVFLLAVDE